MQCNWLHFSAPWLMIGPLILYVSLRGVAQIGHSDESSAQSAAFWGAASEKQIVNQSEASKGAGGKSLDPSQQHVPIVTAMPRRILSAFISHNCSPNNFFKWLSSKCSAGLCICSFYLICILKVNYLKSISCLKWNPTWQTHIHFTQRRWSD